MRDNTLKDEIYALLPEQAKPASAFWATVQTVLFLMLTQLVLGVIGAIVGVIIYASIDATFFQTLSDLPPDATSADIFALLGPALNFILPAYLIGAFGGLWLMAALKTSLEKRSLSTIGLGKFLYGGKFWTWFLFGILFAVLVTAWTAAIGGIDLSSVESDATPDWSLVMQSSVLIAFAVVFLLLLVQAPAEEIFFRGWLMSAVSARNGIVTGIVLSSFLFMAAHLFNTLGADTGITVYNLFAVGSLGLLLAAIALSHRSILPAAGFHTGYNLFLFILGFSYTIATTGETDFTQLFISMMDVEQMPDAPMTAAFWLDLGGRLAITLVPAAVLFSRRKQDG